MFKSFIRGEAGELGQIESLVKKKKKVQIFKMTASIVRPLENFREKKKFGGKEESALLNIFEDHSLLLL
jgi:hypothetical protein